jgi:hypothetical protein
VISKDGRRRPSCLFSLPYSISGAEARNAGHLFTL